MSSAKEVSSVGPATEDTESTGAPKEYGRSVFLTACGRYWRALWIFLLVMVVNAIVQPLLTLSNAIPSLTSPTFLLLAFISYAVLVLSLGVIISAALMVPTGKVTLAQALAQLKANFGNFVLWTVAWTAVITIGLSLWVYPGLIIMLITPFVPISAAAGQRNALKANFQAIGARKGRYVVTLIVSLVFLVLLYVVIALFNWLITDVPGYVIGWLVLGLVGPWLVTGFALLYRSTPVGALPVTTDAPAS